MNLKFIYILFIPFYLLFNSCDNSYINKNQHIASKDSIRLITEEGSDAFDRNKVMLIQTPQTFHSKILLPAFQIDYKDKFTDEATVAEAYGMKVSLVEGEENNIKITRPIDLLFAENIVGSSES